jgi:uncharacterized protein YbaR (Trm112 family)
MKVCDICGQKFDCAINFYMDLLICPECMAKGLPTEYSRYIECHCGERLWVMDIREGFKIKCPRCKTGYSK